MEFQDAKRAMKAVYGHSNSESSDNECHKVLHIMFGGSWDIMSQRIVNTLCLEVVASLLWRNSRSWQHPVKSLLVLGART
jgi:hypothetical protein